MGEQRQVAVTLYAQADAPVRRFLSVLPSLVRTGEANMAEQARGALSEYQSELERRRAPKTAIAPARYAQAVVIDHAVRQLSNVRLNAWMAAAEAHLFDRRDITVETVRRFRQTAVDQGGELTELAEFLDATIKELEGGRRQRETLSRGPAILLGAGSLLLIVALGIYAAFLDWRIHERLWVTFNEQAAQADLAGLRELSDALSDASQTAPFASVFGEGTIPWASGPRGRAVYEQAVSVAMPDALRTVIGDALATEGEDLALYDTVRAWAILSAQSEWSATYLAGWLNQRGRDDLAQHVAAMSGPVRGISVPDDTLYEQAVAFASAAPEVDRAFLELTRQDAVAALPEWEALEAVPELEEVFIRRSGAPVTDSVSPLYTAAGWRYAFEVGMGVAVETTRREAAALLQTTSREVSTPDAIADRLQQETIREWKVWLGDLRVHPFSDQDRAVRVSGALARRDSALSQLIRAVWTEVGGGDTTRSFDQQTLIRAAFTDAIAYVDSGRVAQLSALFAALNVALGTIEVDADQGADRLLKVQELAQSASALTAAPDLVVEITEDVLAQSGAAHASLLSNPLTKEWQTRVYPLCRQVVEGRFPFDDNGPGAPLDGFAALFGPSGALNAFLTGVAADKLDIGGDIWRWSPTARLSGVSQESAQFLQQAYSVSTAFFDPAGAFGDGFSVAALAERGQAAIFVGGSGGAVRADGGVQNVAWPGPSADGAEIGFTGGGRLSEPGLWGFLKLLDRTRMRVRDNGLRHLVDVQVENNRVFLEIAATRALNPVSGRRLARGLTCPSVL